MEDVARVARQLDHLVAGVIVGKTNAAHRVGIYQAQFLRTALYTLKETASVLPIVLNLLFREQAPPAVVEVNVAQGGRKVAKQKVHDEPGEVREPQKNEVAEKDEARLNLLILLLWCQILLAFIYLQQQLQVAVVGERHEQNH